MTDADQIKYPNIRLSSRAETSGMKFYPPRPLKAILLHSDDWGLAGWTPTKDIAQQLGYGHMKLPYKDYGFSRLESTPDLDALFLILSSISDGVGLPAIMQANYIVGAIEYINLSQTHSLSFVELPQSPKGWDSRDIIKKALEGIALGVWRPEYHGYTHCNSSVVRKLSISDQRSRNALSLGCPPFHEPESWLEYKDSVNQIGQGLKRFSAIFGYRATSTIPPNGVIGLKALISLLRGEIRIFQAPEKWITLDLISQAFAYLLKYADTLSLPVCGVRRDIDFEPRGKRHDGSEAALWEPFVDSASLCLNRRGYVCISTHRINFAHHDDEFVAINRRHLHQLLQALVDRNPAAVFLTDAEYVQLRRSGVSYSKRGSRHIIRNHARAARNVKLPTHALESIAARTESAGETPLKITERGPAFSHLLAQPGTYVIV